MNDFILVMLVGWGIEALVGWPDWLYRRIKHPVVWIGSLIGTLEHRLNVATSAHLMRYVLGALTSLFVVALSCTFAWGVSYAMPNTWYGITLEALAASSLLASRSLYTHVRAVITPLRDENIPAARQAVAQIVGRETADLDEAGVSRAALESLAENASDGVIAPVFWGSLLGLPGLVGYKAINTLDSMIGHKSERYLAFGGFAARLDDVANFVPARLTALLFALSSGAVRAWRAMLGDARKHASPNAGWPESAMAGALNVSLGGPRDYTGGEKASDHAWLNATGCAPTSSHLMKGLSLYLRAMGLAAAILLGCAYVTR
ncbi:MAG: adenosylcobinamide-phosphate synthase CbiB [Pseudomonadota bacterium]